MLCWAVRERWRWRGLQHSFSQSCQRRSALHCAVSQPSSPSLSQVSDDHLELVSLNTNVNTRVTTRGRWQRLQAADCGVQYSKSVGAHCGHYCELRCSVQRFPSDHLSKRGWRLHPQNGFLSFQLSLQRRPAHRPDCDNWSVELVLVGCAVGRSGCLQPRCDMCGDSGYQSDVYTDGARAAPAPPVPAAAGDGGVMVSSALTEQHRPVGPSQALRYNHN